jgi:nucleoside-diphosphate kinase
MIKPDAYTNIGRIIDAIEQSGFLIGNIRMAKMTLRDAEEFYAEHKVKKNKILT